MKNIYDINLDNKFSFLRYGENEGRYNKNFSHTYCLETYETLEDFIDVLKFLLSGNFAIVKKSILLSEPHCTLAIGEKVVSWGKLRIEKVSKDENIGLFPYENNNSIALKLHDENLLDFIECLIFISENNQEQFFVVGDDKIFVAP